MPASNTAVRERPLLFSGPMVQAILAGRKVQTRRVMVPQPKLESDTLVWGKRIDTWTGWARGTDRAGKPHPQWLEECPYGAPGDHLWIRESFLPCKGTGHEHPIAIKDASYVCFRDGSQKFRKGEYVHWTRPVNESAWPAKARWRPSIHMPHWASRITLEIESVRVERLQNITEADAQAEGVERPVLSFDTIPGIPPPFNRVHPMTGDYRDAFRELWEKLNGKRGFSWESNCWVWVIGFRVVEPAGGDT